MMNFLNNMNLIPKNFIVANIVDTLKDDPENGAEKVFEMADKFVKDPDTMSLIEQIKDAYYTRPTIRMYAKNLIYNTEKSCLNNFVQNIVVKELIEGITKREELSKKYQVEIPHSFVLNMGADKISEIDRIVGQAKELGIHFIILTKDNNQLLKIYEKHSDVQFVVLTDGSSLTLKRCQELAKVGNMLPMIMLDAKVGHSAPDLGHLKSSGLLYGIITPTDLSNYQHVTSDEFILPLIRQGSRLNWYVTSSTEEIGKQSMLQLKHRIDYIRKMRPYIGLHLSTDQPVKNQGISGSFTVEEMVNQKMYRITFPEVNAQNSQGKNLLQIFKSQ